MAEARQEHWWEVASTVMALVANCHRDSKKHPTPFLPATFNPLAQRAEDEPLPIGMSVLKQVFVDSANKKPKPQVSAKVPHGEPRPHK